MLIHLKHHSIFPSPSPNSWSSFANSSSSATANLYLSFAYCNEGIENRSIEYRNPLPPLINQINSHLVGHSEHLLSPEFRSLSVLKGEVSIVVDDNQRTFRVSKQKNS